MKKESYFVSFSRPFIDATRNVFKTMVFTDITCQRPTIKTTSMSQGDVSAVMGISGENQNGSKRQYSAQFVISWPYQTYLNCANAMLSEDFQEYTSDIADVGGEICNIIVGNAKRELSKMNMTTNMAIPSLIEGKNHSINYPKGVTIVLMPIKSEHGNFFIDLCYREF